MVNKAQEKIPGKIPDPLTGLPDLKIKGDHTVIPVKRQIVQPLQQGGLPGLSPGENRRALGDFHFGSVNPVHEKRQFLFPACEKFGVSDPFFKICPHLSPFLCREHEPELEHALKLFQGRDPKKYYNQKNISFDPILKENDELTAENIVCQAICFFAEVS